MTTIMEKLTVVTPANWVSGPKQGHWTYYHYAALPEDGYHYEIVEGVLFMTPAPGIYHQKAVLQLARYLLVHVEDAGLGQVFIAPVDVELAENTVVQPDVAVVLNAGIEKITPSCIVGAPDLVVEVSSPSTVGFDRREKQDAYAQAGIKEYWLADPLAHTVEILLLEGGIYHSQHICSGQEMLISTVVPTMAEVTVAKLFA